MDMGLSFRPNPNCYWQSLHPRGSYFVQSRSEPAMGVFHRSVRKPGGSGRNGAVSHHLMFRSPSGGSTTPEARSVKRACSSNFDELCNEELTKQIEGLAELFDHPDEDDEGFDFREEMEKYKNAARAVSDGCRCRVLQSTTSLDTGLSTSTRFPTAKLDFLKPCLLGIQPEPPEWPERNEIVRSKIERKANSVKLPLSLRIIQRKRQWLWQEGFKGTDQNVDSSMNKAFASMVYTIQAIQSHALYMRDTLYSENSHGALAKAQREMNVSSVFLFQHVFWRTPTLMVDLTVLLANFSVFSVTESTVIGAAPSSVIEGTGPLAEDMTDSVSSELTKSSTSISYPDSVQNETLETQLKEDDNLTAEEVKLWKSIVHEASRLAEESGTGVLDRDALNLFISPVKVEFEADNFEDYRKTDHAYRMSIVEEPSNPILLSNYGQFLCLVAHDYDRAEDCFRRALQIDPQDSEALIRYADFLWIVRKDAWGAEERYLQAIAADPGNSYHASKYANFLWSTGGDETCFPLAS